MGTEGEPVQGKRGYHCDSKFRHMQQRPAAIPAPSKQVEEERGRHVERHCFEVQREAEEGAPDHFEVAVDSEQCPQNKANADVVVLKVPVVDKEQSR